MFVEYILLWKKQLSFAGAFRRWTQQFSKIYKEKYKIKQICI